MSRFNTNTSHPLIPNSQDYTVYKKYVSINSNDRDIIKYPDASEFEIMLPQDYLNVLSVKLDSWTFPANYNTFSLANDNIVLSFKLTNLYNPGENNLQSGLYNTIFTGLYENLDSNYIIQIEEGFYNPEQMAIELTNKMNAIVTDYLEEYMTSINSPYLDTFLISGGYNEFVVAYNSVGQKLWFGNKSCGFIMTNNDETVYYRTFGKVSKSCRFSGNGVPEFNNWGLPSYLGFFRCNVEAISNPNNKLPRFYYGSYINGDNGYWLTPNILLPNSKVYFFECPEKINLMGPSYFFLDIKELNNIDECLPYSMSNFTTTTNETNNVVNSAFAKIPVTTTPLAQWFDNESNPYKLFNPPAERIRKLTIKLRYHNGILPAFGNFEYSFLLEFTLYNSQIARKYNIYHPEV
jgi:hypothetical protein